MMMILEHLETNQYTNVIFAKKSMFYIELKNNQIKVLCPRSRGPEVWERVPLPFKCKKVCVALCCATFICKPLYSHYSHLKQPLPPHHCPQLLLPPGRWWEHEIMSFVHVIAIPHTTHPMPRPSFHIASSIHSDPRCMRTWSHSRTSSVRSI